MFINKKLFIQLSFVVVVFAIIATPAIAQSDVATTIRQILAEWGVGGGNSDKNSDARVNGVDFSFAIKESRDENNDSLPSSIEEKPIHKSQKISIAEFVLFDAESKTKLKTLENKDTININENPTVSIGVVTSPSVAHKVEFNLKGDKQHDYSDPYAYPTNDTSEMVALDLSLGKYSLQAVPYDANTGDRGIPETLQFEVVE